MTEDVVREALEKAADFIDQHNQCACDNPMQPAQDALTIFLQHILDAGPDERMFDIPIGVRALIDGGLLWDTAESNLLSHLIERLQEQK